MYFPPSTFIVPCQREGKKFDAAKLAINDFIGKLYPLTIGKVQVHFGRYIVYSTVAHLGRYIVYSTDALGGQCHLSCRFHVGADAKVKCIFCNLLIKDFFCLKQFVDFPMDNRNSARAFCTV